jgi:DNA-binding MarR family transcriptional regulator
MKEFHAAGAADTTDRVRRGLYGELLDVIIVLQKDFLHFHHRFAFGELSRLHMGVLGVLSRHEELPLSVVADKLYTARPQMTVLIDRLESLGLVLRKADAADRRVTTVGLTEAGRKALEEGVDAAHREIASRLSTLTDREMEAFGSALKTIQKLLSKVT